MCNVVLQRKMCLFFVDWKSKSSPYFRETVGERAISGRRGWFSPPVDVFDDEVGEPSPPTVRDTHPYDVY